MSEASLPEALGILRVLLGDALLVGELSFHADERMEFRLAPAYLESYPRPVLGQVFEDNTRRVHRSRMQLPPFFSNLLPEARNRELIAARIGVAPAREAHLLAYLGDDLPGNVRVVAEGALPEVSSEQSLPAAPDLQHPIKYSLAGVQPKLSMFRGSEGLTFPATGRGGNWLVKTPGTRHQGAAENEFFSMSWARESGITVPEIALESMAGLRNVPPELQQETGNAYAVARFDRPIDRPRIHIEDFAQVFDVYASYDGKYKKANYESIARVLHALSPSSWEEFVRRMVFVVLSANADAHVKNWSLWYPDGVTAALSPAYDLVSTIEFIEEDSLALNLAGSKRWDSVTLDSFSSLANRAGADASETKRVARESVERTRAAWDRVSSLASPLLRQRLVRHWENVPLASLR